MPRRTNTQVSAHSTTIKIIIIIIIVVEEEEVEEVKQGQSCAFESILGAMATNSLLPSLKRRQVRLFCAAVAVEATVAN